MRGTNIAGVEGQWLNNGPNHSVPETRMTALRLELTFLIYFPPQNMWDHCDFILWCHNWLPYSFGRKTTAHAQRKCHSSSVHLLVSLLKSLVTITTPKPHHLFLVPNFVPVTLSPRYFSVPLVLESEIYLQHLRMDTEHRHVLIISKTRGNNFR